MTEQEKPEQVCADCGQPRDAEHYHYEAPGNWWGAAIHHFRPAEPPAAPREYDVNDYIDPIRPRRTAPDSPPATCDKTFGHGQFCSLPTGHKGDCDMPPAAIENKGTPHWSSHRTAALEQENVRLANLYQEAIGGSMQQAERIAELEAVLRKHSTHEWNCRVSANRPDHLWLDGDESRCTCDLGAALGRKP